MSAEAHHRARALSSRRVRGQFVARGCGGVGRHRERSKPRSSAAQCDERLRRNARRSGVHGSSLWRSKPKSRCGQYDERPRRRARRSGLRRYGTTALQAEESKCASQTDDRGDAAGESTRACWNGGIPSRAVPMAHFAEQGEGGGGSGIWTRVLQRAAAAKRWAVLSVRLETRCSKPRCPHAPPCSTRQGVNSLAATSVCCGSASPDDSATKRRESVLLRVT